MPASDRRGVLTAIGSMLALPVLGLAGPVNAARSIILPTRQFILRRELEQGLAGGSSLTVAREWKGRFEALAGGSRVTGEQIICTVDAPPHLEPIAAIERNRIAAGPFPARLDADGRMIGNPVEQAQGTATAVRTASSVLEQAGKSARELREARQFLSRLSEAAGTVISAPPPDLFFPHPGSAREVRTLKLPDGAAGEVTVELTAGAGLGGLLDIFERRIATRIGDDSRLSRETWRLRLA